MPIYEVTMQDEKGEVETKEFFVRWDSEKVDADEVGRACATQSRYFSGKCTRQGEPSFKRLWQCISAVVVMDEAQLVMDENTSE